jgi:hypothetical protein
MPYNTLHDDYSFASKRWQTTRDATAGQDVIKAKGEAYLPGFIPADEDRYKQYLKFAYYVNVTGRTKKGLMDGVFRKPSTSDIPLQIDYAEENADGAGQSVDQVAKQVVGDSLETGRYGILVDYPQAVDGLSQEEVSAQDLKAYMGLYTAENIVNWNTTVVNGRSVISLVVLRETIEELVDEFSSKDVEVYRVLILNEGLYEQRVYKVGSDSADVVYEPRKADGSRWTEIPFVFIGSEDNLPDIDMTPLFDLANINIAQYRNIADREAALRVFSQVMLHVDIGETSDAMWQESNPNGIMFGASKAVITQKGKVELIQAEANNFGSQAVKDKAEEMVSVGARLIDKQGVNETAEAARISASSEMSVLGTLVGNVSDGITKALNYMGEFMGATTEASYSLNREFFDSKLTPQEVMAVIQLADRGDLTDQEVETILNKQGYKATEL